MLSRYVTTMALTNAERQARYRERLKDAAGTIVFVQVADLSFSDRAQSIIPTRFVTVPLPGDSIVVAHGDGEWEAVVLSRTISDNEERGPRILLHCEGKFRRLDDEIKEC